MIKRLLFICCLAAGLASALAVVQSISYTASERISIGTTPIGFSSTLITGGAGHPQATSALCRLETAEIRWTVDPSIIVTATTNGALLEVGEWLPQMADSVLLTNFRAVRTGGSNGTLACFYFG